MCGIVGYIGAKNASEVIINGLEKLEYRGYDSAGIALNTEHSISEIKERGRLVNLKNVLEVDTLYATCGIGHTRWATHGEPSRENAHPHLSFNKNIAVVHNGIIENYQELKKDLQKKGYEFRSDTDTEVIAHLIEDNYNGDFLESVFTTVEKLQGSYALGIIDNSNKGTIIAARKGSPLIIGLGEGENIIASDVPALLKYTRNVKYIMDDEVVVLTKDDVTIYNRDKKILDRETSYIDWDFESSTKNGFDHFMHKEIYDQPKAVADTIKRALNSKGEVEFEDISFTKEELNNIDKIYIVACGTAYNAGLMGKHAIEKLVDIPVICEIGSEFRYNKNFVTDKTLVIAISQSGETLDTLVSLKDAKENGATVLVITNVVGSSIAREAHKLFYTAAGPEIAVASTKAYTTQMVTMYLLALYMAKVKETIEVDRYTDYLNDIRLVSKQIESTFDNLDLIKEVAESIKDSKHVFYLGRSIDFYLAKEASLKLKEISYIHAEAMPSGELKHGTIALVEKGTNLVFIALNEKLYDKTLSNIKEIKARGGKAIVITKEGHDYFDDNSDYIITVPNMDDFIAPLYGIVPFQLLAYYVTVGKGLDVDKPRNLAKSVTVE